MKVEIKTKNYEIDAEEVIEKEVKEFSKSSAHIVLPKKWIGYDAIVVLKRLTGRAMSMWGKEAKRRNKNTRGKHND